MKFTHYNTGSLSDSRNEGLRKVLLAFGALDSPEAPCQRDSYAAKLRFSLGDKGGDAFLRVLGTAGGDDRLLLVFELIGKAGLE